MARSHLSHRSFLSRFILIEPRVGFYKFRMKSLTLDTIYQLLSSPTRKARCNHDSHAKQQKEIWEDQLFMIFLSPFPLCCENRRPAGAEKIYQDGVHYSPGMLIITQIWRASCASETIWSQRAQVFGKGLKLASNDDTCCVLELGGPREQQAIAPLPIRRFHGF